MFSLCACFPHNVALTENDVVKAVRTHLEAAGWTTHGISTAERGVDIIATQGSRRMEIEAKGATSSKAGTRRYGLGFTPNQVRSHVSVALYTAAAVTSRNDKCRAALALPDDAAHRAVVARIGPALKRLEIAVFWVDAEGRTVVDTPFPL